VLRRTCKLKRAKVSRCWRKLHLPYTVPAVDNAGVWQLVPGDRMVPVSIPLAHVMAKERSKFVSMDTSPVQTKHG
jgi:hypothetical protein